MFVITTTTLTKLKNQKQYYALDLKCTLPLIGHVLNLGPWFNSKDQCLELEPLGWCLGHEGSPAWTDYPAKGPTA